MGNPRRMLLAVLAMLCCVAGYVVYSQVLGGVDGLPGLPEKYAKVADQSTIAQIAWDQRTPIQQKLEQAFGPGCLEIAYRMQFEIGTKGIVLAANTEGFTKEGNVVFSPCSFAIFAKPKPGVGQEISSLHCDRAILKFDKPVHSLNDLNGRRIVRADLISDPELPVRDPRKGRVQVRNNRRTPDPGDDIEVVTVGPIVYMDEEGDDGVATVTTDAILEMFDWQNSAPLLHPEKMGRIPTVVARGMKMMLAAEKPDPKKADPKKPNPSPGRVTGVESVQLSSEVTMNIWADSKSNFLSAPEPGKPAAADVSLIQIETQGPFRYDLKTDLAVFENAPSANPNLPNHIRVVRKTKGDRLDMLKCDNLELQFKRIAAAPPAKDSNGKPVPPAPRKDDGQPKMSIERAHAWGQSIALSSDNEMLHASGNDLVYEAANRTTVLKGNPEDGVYAVKEGNLIRANCLVLQGQEPKPGQPAGKNDSNGIRMARAQGPGDVGIGDFDPVEKRHTRSATWNDWLTFTRAKEDGRDYQILTLTGKANFSDSVNKQSLSGEELRVWVLEPEPVKDAPKVAAAVKDTPAVKGAIVAVPAKIQPKPVRLEADRNVHMRSPQMILHEADKLVVLIKDLPEEKALPAAPKDGPPGLPGAKVDPKQPEKKEEPRPVEIRARRMDAWLTRSGTKNELDRAVCTGDVRVDQAPPPDKKRGMSFTAAELILVNHGDNNHLLTLKAEAGVKDPKPAEIHMEELSLLGPLIIVDQRDNHVKVDGAGALRMKSSTNLQGEKTAIDSNLFIHWRDAMEFDGAGKWARFLGNVQAEQQFSDYKVLCGVMQVDLDREVFFNPQQKKTRKDDKTSPRIDRVRCDKEAEDPQRPNAPLQKVIALEEKREKNKLLRYQRIECLELDYENNLEAAKQTTGNTKAHGPGVVRIFQPGSDDMLGPKPVAKPVSLPKQPAPEVMKLTWINFTGQMQTFGRQRAKFLGDTTVIHLPTNDPELKVQKGGLLPGSFEMYCNRSLTVTTVEAVVEKNVKTTHRMDAEGDVRVLSDDFSGRAENVKYDEAKGVIIFVGTSTNPATWTRTRGVGGDASTLSGERISYNLRTKQPEVEKGFGSRTSN